MILMHSKLTSSHLAIPSRIFSTFPRLPLIFLNKFTSSVSRLIVIRFKPAFFKAFAWDDNKDPFVVKARSVIPDIFFKRLIRFIIGLVFILFIPIVFIAELIKWAFEIDDAFDCFDGLWGEIFEILTFSLFNGGSDE